MARLSVKNGMTLVELMIALMILLPLFTITIETFIKYMDLNEFASNSSLALWAARNQMTAVEQEAFSDINAKFDNTTFAVPGLKGLGRVDVTALGADAVTVRMAVCWKQTNGRIIGEDLDLDGVLDTGEDNNGNGMIDSIILLETQISNI